MLSLGHGGAHRPPQSLEATPQRRANCDPEVSRRHRTSAGNTWRQRKDYAGRFNHLLVSDDHTSSAYIRKLGNRIVSVVLPWNTGKDKGTFYSYRIVAGFFHLVSPDYVLFLDGPVNPRGCCCVPHSATAPFRRLNARSYRRLLPYRPHHPRALALSPSGNTNFNPNGNPKRKLYQ